MDCSKAMKVASDGRWYRPLFLLVPLLLFSLVADVACVTAAEDPRLGSIRVVFQLKYGDIEFGFYPEVAPVTVKHILKLVKLGAYNTNHFFRVDRGFVAQVADVTYGREARMNAEQREEAAKTIIGEFSNVKHVRGILSMGRYEDPNSAGSSFSILLNAAPHLDGQYAVFGKVTKGYDTLAKLEEVETRTEGIFVMPLERINILSSYHYDLADIAGGSTCEDEVVVLRERLRHSADLIEAQVLVDAEKDVGISKQTSVPVVIDQKGGVPPFYCNTHSWILLDHLAPHKVACCDVYDHVGQPITCICMC